MREYIATFYSHYGAVCFKKSCDRQGMDAVIMPVPRDLSSSCGTCVKFSGNAREFPEINEELEQIVEICPEGYRIIRQTDED